MPGGFREVEALTFLLSVVLLLLADSVGPPRGRAVWIGGSRSFSIPSDGRYSRLWLAVLGPGYTESLEWVCSEVGWVGAVRSVGDAAGSEERVV